MNKLMIDSLLEIFAFIANIKGEHINQLTESYIEILFSKFLNPKLAKEKKERFIILTHQIKENPRLININNLCKNINKELPKGQRIMLLINLIDFVTFTEKNALVTTQEGTLNKFIENIANKLNVSKKTLQNCKNFVTNQFHNIPDQESLVFAKEEDPGFKQSKFIEIWDIKGFIVFIHIEEANLVLFKYNGSSILQLNAKLIFPQNIYTFQSGSVISCCKRPIIYYSQIVKITRSQKFDSEITLQLSNVKYTHRKTSFGVKNIDFTCSSGELIGIIGGSGSGKTTLLNIINGNIKPDNGTIEINGNSYGKNLKSIQKLIGFVPQDDSLIGELTVYENLYFTAQLSNASSSDSEISTKVDNILSEFSLHHIRNQRIGLPVKRQISGGQRKRLNIVLELVHEPKMLLVDEPTSGLSSSDSFKILVLLKEQASKGKLVITNIHQPSSDMFRLFDKVLVLDQGGFMVYFGNPIEAIEYFRAQSGQVDETPVECTACHTIKPDEIFEIIEENLVDELGEVTENRKRSPKKWNTLFKENEKGKNNPTPTNTALPLPDNVEPSQNTQLYTFFKRLAITKLRDKEFVIYTLFIPTLLSLITSFFSKYFIILNGNYSYNYYENDNIPIFFLMSITACFFTGLILSADSLIKDILLRKREKFLFLSKLPYINSKILFFAAISAIQTIIFTTIAVIILHIPGDVIKFGNILFVTSLLGNITGIILSSLIKSTTAAYIIVPFLVIPQIIFSGIAIPFEKLNYVVAQKEKVPVIGNITLSRWGMEAIMVNQFKDNLYEIHFFDIDKNESQTRIKAYFLIPEIVNLIDEYPQIKNDEQVERQIGLINSGIKKLGFKPITNDKQNLANLKSKLYLLKNSLIQQHSKLVSQKNQRISKLAEQLGSMENLIKLKQQQTNSGIEKFMLNRQAIQVLEFTPNNTIVQNIDPIFTTPNKGLFNARFFAADKTVFGHEIDTYIVNTTLLLLIFISLYILLLLIFHFKNV